ncbi:bacteriophage protein [Sphingomonas sp. LH128]|uniref:efflux RND transporter permease subunit n=1 Tax=Sphingomonas sp. LH128 TaxID=473781 RepID=UPI00027CC1EC|nr:efflux RND transporter permease subunit [Sphingomonas sp. LH128]EJU14922.1 bacteriophage protein [Sphingomonas sp. LH128]
MPRVPNYQPGQVGPVRTTGERFQAPSGPGAAGILAEGLAGASRLLSQQDQINAENDETQSRLALAQARNQYASAVDQYKGTKLGAARAGQEGFDKGLDQIREGALNSATSPRMRRMIEEGLLDIDGTARRMGASHALGESRAETSASFQIEQDSLIDAAVSSDSPQFRDQSGLQLRDSVRRQLQFDGFDEAAMPDAYAVAEKAAMSKMHAGVLDRMFAQADPDIDEVGQYLGAYRDEITSDLYTKTLARLQGPLQERVDDYRADLITVAPTEGAAPVGAAPGPWQGVAIDVAKRFGLDPSDVAAVMSYETGGTFSPTIMGGKGGQYMGLIQFGPAERKKYGIDKTSDPAEWTKAVGDYLEDRGFKRGMGVMDLYSTINAGQPGRYNASDGNGTVTSHVAEILGAHKEKAKGWLGGAGVYSNAPRQWDKAAVFEQIDQKAAAEQWSPEQTKRVRNVWARRMSTDEGLLSEQRRSADEAATTLLAGAGDKFRTSMIPPATWSQLSPDQKIQFQNIEKQLTKAEAPTANGEAVVALHRMAAGGLGDQAKFAGLNLAKYRAYMTPGEYDEIATAQVKAQQDLRNPKAQDTRGKIDGAITRAKKWVGVEVDKNPTEGFRVRRYMESRAADEAVGGKTLSDADYDRLFRDATRDFAWQNTFLGIGTSKGTKRSSEALSPNYRSVIVSSFRRANGRDPNEDEIATAWEAMGKPGS